MKNMVSVPFGIWLLGPRPLANCLISSLFDLIQWTPSLHLLNLGYSAMCPVSKLTVVPCHARWYSDVVCAVAACIGSVSSGGVGSVSSVGAGVSLVGTLHGMCLLWWEHGHVGTVMVVKVGCKLGSEMSATGVG